MELAKLREAKRTGKGPRSLAEKREIADSKRKAEEEARRTEEAARITTENFWLNNYRPAQGHKAHGASLRKKPYGVNTPPAEAGGIG